jgi:hypothetical protein
MTSKLFDSRTALVHRPGQVLDRRAFLGNAGIAAGALIVSGFVPLSSEHTSQTGRSTAAAASESPGAGADSLWHVDDMWGHWPRYAHPIPHACVQLDTACWEKAAPIDRMWVS